MRDAARNSAISVGAYGSCARSAAMRGPGQTASPSATPRKRKVRSMTPGSLELLLPRLPQLLRPEQRVRLGAHQAEAGLLVDVAGGGEDAVGPEGDPPVAGGAGEGDALVHQAAAEPQAARRRLHEQEAQLRHLVGLPDEKDRADDLAAPLGDPAALAGRVQLLDELGDDGGDQRLEALVPAVLLPVEDAVAVDHPPDVARAVRAQ